jgi:hypothetical protein
VKQKICGLTAVSKKNLFGLLWGRWECAIRLAPRFPPRPAPILWRENIARFGPQPSPEHVFGWAIIDRTPDSLTLESHSWLLTSRLVFGREQSRVSVSTFVRFDKKMAASRKK